MSRPSAKKAGARLKSRGINFDMERMAKVVRNTDGDRDRDGKAQQQIGESRKGRKGPLCSCDIGKSAQT